MVIDATEHDYGVKVYSGSSTGMFKDVTLDEVVSALIQAIGWEHTHWGRQEPTTKPLPWKVSSISG